VGEYAFVWVYANVVKELLIFSNALVFLISRGSSKCQFFSVKKLPLEFVTHLLIGYSYHDFVDGVRNTPEYYNDILHISNKPDVPATEKDHHSTDYFSKIISSPNSSSSAISSLSINSSLILSLTTPSSSYSATPATLQEIEDTYKISRASGGVVPSANVAVGAEEIIERVYRPNKEALDENFCQGWQMLKQVEELPAKAVLRFCSRHKCDFDTIQWLDTMTVGWNSYQSKTC
jgi:hypothetical protein